MWVKATGGRMAASADGTITASDTTKYDPPLRVVWATGAGNISVVLSGEKSGSTNYVTIPVAANERVTDFEIRKVLATGTTATGISGAH